jgi:thymidylate kinase
MVAVDDFQPGQDQSGLRPAIDPNIVTALNALERTGQPWLLMRGEDDLARPSGDVDLLVSEELLPELDELLEGAGFCRVLAPGHGSHRFYFCYSPADDFWVKLDIVSDITFGPYQELRTPLAKRCLRHRVRRGLLWLPASGDQAWLQLLHLFLDKGEIAPSRIDAARIAARSASTAAAIAAFVDRRMGAGVAAQALDLVLSEKFHEVPAMAARMRATWTSTSASPSLLGARNRGLRLLGARLPGRGLVVGAMAPDGAGKTTLLHGLQATVPLPTKYVYMGMWGGGPWDSWLRRIPGGLSAKKVFRLLRGGLLARSNALLGRMVLMDRVAYDVMLQGSGHAGAVGRVIDLLALRLVPAPDILLVLDVSGQVMFARKGEHSAEILENWRQSYRQLADRLPGAHVLDADRTEDLVRRHAAGIVWGSITPGARETEGSAPQGSDALPLHLWALLDWRFLVPVLEPQSVGYGGRISGDLKSALHMLDPQATLLHSGDSGTSGKLFDVVLLSAPDLRLFESAAAKVQPGGWMCARVRRSLVNRSGPRTLAGWKRTFAQNGFTDVGIDWHVPSLERPSRIVPVASATAISDTLSLHKDVRFGKAKAVAGHLALALRLFDMAVPEGTVTGRRPQAEESHEIH